MFRFQATPDADIAMLTPPRLPLLRHLMPPLLSALPYGHAMLADKMPLLML